MRTHTRTNTHTHSRTQAIKKEAFEKAIQSDDAPINQEDPADIEVEASYTGPRTEDGNITLQFVNDLMEHQKQEKKLHKKYALEILYKVREIFKAEPSVVDVAIPEDKHVTVCGDVHGQYYDLCNIFELNGKPSETNPYLFNGDFVDRGSFSIEVLFSSFWVFLFGCRMCLCVAPVFLFSFSSTAVWVFARLCSKGGE